MGKPKTYMVITQHVVGSPGDCTTEYRSDGRIFPSRDLALRHGWRTLDHDDFNIGTFIDDRLVAFGWGDHDFGPDQDGAPHGGYDLAAIQQAVTP